MAFISPIPLSLKPSTHGRTFPRASSTPAPTPRTPRRTRPHPDSFTNHTLLKPHQERTLLLKIRVLQTINSARDHLATVLNRAPTESELSAHLGLSPSQLNSRTLSGIRARNDLVSANLRLVVRIATQVHSRLARQTPQNIPLEDLVQEGCLALIKAAERFDVDSGNRFSSFAYSVVYYACLREAPRGSIVSIPERLRQVRRKIRSSVVDGDWEGVKVMASGEEEELSTPMHLLKAAEPHLKGALALDVPTGSGNTTLHDMLQSSNPQPEEILQRELVTREIRTACYRSLPERYADVLIIRFGLNGSPPKAGREIAKIYGVSEPRIAQIVLAAMEKLRKEEPDLVNLMYDL